MDEARNRLVEHLRWQADWCATLGSPLYADLLRHTAEKAAELWPVLAVVAHDPLESAPALRFMGAVHRIVLEGRAPELARFYPSAGGSESGDPREAFIAILEAN